MLATQIKTASDLRMFIEEAGHSPHFFERDTMRCFGDSMRNYGVRRAVIGGRAAWELYRRHPVKHGLRSSAYFDAETFKRVFPTVIA
jgi:hypothetical protein